MSIGLVCLMEEIKKNKNILEKNSLYNKILGVQSFDKNSKMVPTKLEFNEVNCDKLRLVIPNANFIKIESNEILKNDFKICFSRYKIFDDLLFYTNVKDFEIFAKLDNNIKNDFIESMKIKYGVHRIVFARGPIINGDFRLPQIYNVDNCSTDVSIIENSIKYSFNLEKVMFSKGNVTEKIRMSKIDCLNEVIVDLFAGIGYFSLQFLKHCNIKHLYACEWNPDSVAFLKRNLKLNNVNDKCTVLFGDCRVVAPIDVANRVYMGLIPNCREYLIVAIRALKNGGIIYMHENVTFKDKPDVNNEEVKLWLSSVIKYLYDLKTRYDFEILSYHVVKSYAPKIYNMVIDINVFIIP